MNSFFKCANYLGLNRRLFSKITYNVNKFGLLDLQSVTDVSVSTIDCQTHPDQNVAFVHYKCLDRNEMNKFQSSWKFDVLKIRNGNELPEHATSMCQIEIPVKFNVLLDLIRKANVSVQNLQNECVNVKLLDGSCTIKDLLTDKLNISASAGDVVAKGSVQTNAVINIKGTGTINAEKIIGETFQASTNYGDVCINSLYVTQSNITTTFGSIKIGHAHKTLNVTITEQGSLDIGIHLFFVASVRLMVTSRQIYVTET
ncbi:hypothetical protein HELRODRAFT_164372 [Helobdella robusta]|uniref:DUF4097 domain-containing protein n=1 Tax=Helobdella robusta TaxID=6412 RepID=T1EVC0_HELRO|nr:hypothetical protein HELRODRAFT_164372 [Helobdella robusta]ESN94516.1 hypothetical protein HELRODRAFT_164372 [Helobdella robusta]